MIKELYNLLKAENLNPHFPGQNQGLCEEPYVTIREGSQIPTVGNVLGNEAVDVIVFVPRRSYIAMEEYTDKIKRTLEGTNLRKTGFETPIILDDKKEAYTTSIEYVVMRRL